MALSIERGDTVRIIRASGMPDMQAGRVGSAGMVVDRYRTETQDFCRVQLPDGAMDFLIQEVDLLVKGAVHASH